MGTLITGLIVAIIVVLVIRKMIKDKKNGKTCCSGGCGCSESCTACNSGKGKSGSDNK